MNQLPVTRREMVSGTLLIPGPAQNVAVFFPIRNNFLDRQSRLSYNWRHVEGDMEPTVEQRKHRRHPVNFQGVFSSATVKGEEGIVQDLSLGGCRVASPISMPSDTAIHLQIRPRQAAPIYVPSAIVRWVRGSTFGVQFQELAEHESKALTRLLRLLPPSRQDCSSNPRSEA